MSRVLFIVKSTISDPAREAEWNQWYNEVHCRQILESPGAICARRFRARMGEDHWQYITLYEFDSDGSFNAFWTSTHRRVAREDYEKTYGAISNLGQHGAYEEIWRSDADGVSTEAAT